MRPTSQGTGISPLGYGKRGGAAKFQTDPHWREYLLFYEYFHGDNGAGLGASYQTGCTGLIAKLIQIFGLLDPKGLLEHGRGTGIIYQESP